MGPQKGDSPRQRDSPHFAHGVASAASFSSLSVIPEIPSIPLIPLPFLLPSGSLRPMTGARKKGIIPNSGTVPILLHPANPAPVSSSLCCSVSLCRFCCFFFFSPCSLCLCGEIPGPARKSARWWSGRHRGLCLVSSSRLCPPAGLFTGFRCGNIVPRRPRLPLAGRRGLITSVAGNPGRCSPARLRRCRRACARRTRRGRPDSREPAGPR